MEVLLYFLGGNSWLKVITDKRTSTEGSTKLTLVVLLQPMELFEVTHSGVHGGFNTAAYYTKRKQQKKQQRG